MLMVEEQQAVPLFVLSFHLPENSDPLFRLELGQKLADALLQHVMNVLQRMHIATASRILRDFTENPIDDVRNDLNNYLSRGRVTYLEMERTVKSNSDIVIEGLLPMALIAPGRGLALNADRRPNV
ncbi:hypothetical protein [Paenibacillus sp. LHD-38]|uniref:hypothetical protein n=1 Tax=Paenibacillus sp. LHD-38 TaxID=3072143 RepID=UPI00280E93F4|nr:hypothetical protein [Paenibacillus sp. LHD-38]MDQ8737033.1 hypothetical protein [Paenibacillus sp. LHD-38]